MVKGQHYESNDSGVYLYITPGSVSFGPMHTSWLLACPVGELICNVACFLQRKLFVVLYCTVGDVLMGSDRQQRPPWSIRKDAHGPPTFKTGHIISLLAATKVHKCSDPRKLLLINHALLQTHAGTCCHCSMHGEFHLERHGLSSGWRKVRHHGRADGPRARPMGALG